MRRVDACLLRTRLAYYDAMERGDIAAAEVLHAELDELLDARSAAAETEITP